MNLYVKNCKNIPSPFSKTRKVMKSMAGMVAGHHHWMHQVMQSAAGASGLWTTASRVAKRPSQYLQCPAWLAGHPLLTFPACCLSGLLLPAFLPVACCLFCPLLPASRLLCAAFPELLAFSSGPSLQSWRCSALQPAARLRSIVFSQSWTCLLPLAMLCACWRDLIAAVLTLVLVVVVAQVGEEHEPGH